MNTSKMKALLAALSTAVIGALALLFFAGVPIHFGFPLAAIPAGVVFALTRGKFEEGTSEAKAGNPHGPKPGSIQEALELLDDAHSRLIAAQDAPLISPGDKTNFGKIARHVKSIRDQVADDPEDYRTARRFITSYLNNLVQTVEKYTKLVQTTKGRHKSRLKPLAQEIQDFIPLIEKLDTACMENDFASLEQDMEATSFQLNRG